MSDPESGEEMAETAEKLDSAIDSTGEEGMNQQSGEDDSGAFVEDMKRGVRDGLLESLGAGNAAATGDGLGEQFGRLLGEMVVRKLVAQMRKTQSAGREEEIGDLDPTELLEIDSDQESSPEVSSDETLVSGVAEDIKDGRRVVEETGELLDTVDLGELPEAIDLSELPEAIDAKEVPAAIANADPERAVKLKRLMSLVEFDELWDAVEVQEFMQNKGELEDAVDDLTDEDGEESSLTDSLGTAGSGGSSSKSGGDESFIAQEEAMHATIQSKLQDAIDEFRGSVLDAHDQLKEARETAQETVEEKTGGGTGQPSSRNPTAYSTMVSGWKTGGWSSSTFSTVPQGTRHSSAPGHFRIYGRRFENIEDEEDDDE